MSSRRITNFRLDEEMIEALLFIKERDGMPVAEQARRALKVWIEQRGVAIAPKAERKRAATRKRS